VVAINGIADQLAALVSQANDLEAVRTQATALTETLRTAASPLAEAISHAGHFEKL
jgi:hypothetical protein